MSETREAPEDTSETRATPEAMSETRATSGLTPPSPSFALKRSPVLLCNSNTKQVIYISAPSMVLEGADIGNPKRLKRMMKKGVLFVGGWGEFRRLVVRP